MFDKIDWFIDLVKHMFLFYTYENSKRIPIVAAMIFFKYCLTNMRRCHSLLPGLIQCEETIHFYYTYTS